MPPTFPIASLNRYTQNFQGGLKVDLVATVWPPAPSKISFPSQTVHFAYSMSYIFWKLLFQPLILAINEDFLSIIRGVRILLTQCNRIEHKIWHHVIVSKCKSSRPIAQCSSRCHLMIIMSSKYAWYQLHFFSRSQSVAGIVVRPSLNFFWVDYKKWFFSGSRL